MLQFDLDNNTPDTHPQAPDGSNAGSTADGGIGGDPQATAHEGAGQSS
eukprot:CAMPEP_0177684326 /NCGR_PEP_ID=MMETSP0447-20121125/32366_1 /TAXON_ID=0 /ORGANISM="Stygamoeba regulata, Strain BSH-02190019" /LENGTH=47 /DNA_ID= /DNA_START= /DNA_END= /DNA_ORIENTATION=